MLESLIAYVTMGLAASFLGLAIVADPHDIEIADISLAESIVQSGYDGLAVEQALMADIDNLVSFAASHHAAKTVSLNLARGGYDRLANMLGVEEAIVVVQQVIGVTGSLVSLRFVEEKDGSYSAAVYIRDPHDLSMIGSANLDVDGQDMALLIQKVSAEIVAITEPYIYATFLYQTEFDNITEEHDTLRRHSATEWVDLQILKSGEDGSDLPWYLNLRGVIALDQKDYRDAIESFIEALAVEDEFPPALVNLGRASIELDSPEQALGYLERTFGHESEYPIAHVYAAQALLRLDRTDEALDQLDQALEIAPDLEFGYLTRAEVLKRMGKLVSANIALEDAKIARIKRPNQSFFQAD